MNNNQKLALLMAKHNITRLELSKVSAFSPFAIKSWLINSESEAYRNLPDSSYKLVSMEIGLWVKGNK